MSALSQFFGGARVISLPAGFSAWIAGSPRGPRVATASGNIATPGAYVTIANITGAGRLSLLAVQSTNATSKTASVRITRDGVLLPVATSTAVAAADTASLVGSIVAGTTTSILADGDLSFDRSLLVELTSSAAETNGFNVFLNYDLRG